MVKAGIANDDESRFKELLGVLIGKCSWYPFATEVVRSGVSGKLKDCTLGVLA